MEDIVSFSAPTSGGPVGGYALYSSASQDGEYSLVTTVGPEATDFAVAVTETGTHYYRVSAIGDGGEGAPSEAADNSLVAITASVTPEGATLRASNGDTCR